MVRAWRRDRSGSSSTTTRRVLRPRRSTAAPRPGRTRTYRRSDCSSPTPHTISTCAPRQASVSHRNPRARRARSGGCPAATRAPAAGSRPGPGLRYRRGIQIGGANVLQAAATVTSVDVDGGTLQLEGDYTVTTLTQTGGTVTDNHRKTSGNAITTLNLQGGTYNAKGSNEARTVATLNLSAGARRTVAS